jgi:Flp pilus assembly protein TadD
MSLLSYVTTPLPAGIAQSSQIGAASQMQQATALLLDRHYHDAEVLLRSMAARDTENAQIHVMLAYACFREDKPRESLEEYTRAAQLRTPTAQDLKWVAEDYVLLNDYADAQKWMSRSVEMNAEDPDAWYALGRIYYTQNLFAKAERCFLRTLTLRPQDERAENNLGLTYEALYKIDEANAAYRNAIRWQDARYPDEQPYLNLGILLRHRGKTEEAESLLRHALEIAPNDPKALMEIAQAHVTLHRMADAESELHKAAKLAPKDAAIHFQLGRVLRKEGKIEEAAAQFQKVAELNGSHSSPDR